MNEILVDPDVYGAVSQPGFALKWACDVFHVRAVAPDCMHAWDSAEFIHGMHESLPDVPVLVWFESDPYGFVAVWDGSHLYCPRADVFEIMPYDSVAQIEKHRGVKALGWSEDINGTRVSIVKENEMKKNDDIVEFDDLISTPIRFDDVAQNYATPRHLSRRDMRRHNRARKIDRWNRELMLFGIIMGASCVFLFAVYVFAVGVMNR